MAYWLAVVNALPVLALVSVTIRPARPAIPWLGLATVAVGTALAFSSSATFYSDRSIGVGIGWVITSIYGFIGLGIVVCYVQFRAVPFIPLGAIVAGVIHIASFYAFIPPLAVEFPSVLPFAAPGFLLVAYGVYLWYRFGLAESLEHRSLLLRLISALGIVAGLAVLGFLQFEAPRPHKWLSHSPNFSRMAEESSLVVEGVVVERKHFNYKAKKTGRTVRYTLYEMDVAHYWRGKGPQTAHFAVSSSSPVEMSLGQSYLIFANGRPNQQELPGYWLANYPPEVLTANDSVFHPYPGLPREAPITREYVAKLLESNPYIGN